MQAAIINQPVEAIKLVLNWIDENSPHNLQNTFKQQTNGESRNNEMLEAELMGTKIGKLHTRMLVELYVYVYFSQGRKD